jgi:hypothetical protein
MPKIFLYAGCLLTTLVVSHHWAKADLLLTVDLATGQAQISATSTIPIDGYAIYSSSGSLTPATWNSLRDQAVTGWEQAPPAPSATAIAELKADGVLVFGIQTGFQIGQSFKTVGVTQDLRLEFMLPNEEVPR